MSIPVFPYTPLSEPDRILHVQPSPDLSPEIISNLEKTTLSKYDHDIHHPYTALSYVWGDASDQRIIRVDGQSFLVTKNLHDALECLRDDKKTLSIWVDAICINQFDVLERNQQVSQMGRIYSSASHTIIFLDSSSDDLDYVLLETERIAKENSEPINAFLFGAGHLLPPFLRILAQPWFHRV
ncbi:hypothetical protein ONS95_001210 [Cadophora gregata]|uniref:uncharacterized protein n=1 Tax=Cadophora gregata TaxID=51156 RepID=UPI0026DB047F|nr:uncharacterized protein ONS95_001210 [Cadophora gregata]KAK0129275.1 hypothetical protein ONS95_001210 [Cadophora gregata]